MSGAVRTSASTPLWFIENLAYIHVDGDQTDNAFSLVEVQGRHGDMPPLHVHNRDDESFFVLDGELTLFVGHEEMKLSKGSAAVAPRQVPHCYRVESEMATFLVINSPAGFERFVAAAGEQAPSAELPPPGRHLDPATLAELAGEQGIEILGPPGALPA
jgi:quercetin dioxygenase-like cupin family protein